ncbi:MAG: GTP-binding protein [Candidatus Hodarchaeales archaeon]|jgi:elongation factor 1-alpha
MADIDELGDEIGSILALSPEEDDGDTEYKRSLLGKSKDRIDGLETQMRYRMEEGDGQCTYVIGVDDDGTPYGLTEEEYEETRGVLDKIAKRNDYSLRLLTSSKCERHSRGETIQGCVYEFLVRENNTIDYEEVKIATGGNVDSAKSTSIGTLISGILDDGRGSTRAKVFNFKHELQTGRTSSISQQILGYDPEGKIVNHDTSIKKISWPEISARSSKIIKFFDLCGHSKYSKTTIRGMMSQSIDYAIITIGANMGARGNTREHISICLTLRIPIIIFLTKIDLGEKAPAEMKKTLSEIKKIFSQPGARRMVFSVDNMNDVITAAKSMKGGDIVPLFKTSNVRGDGLLMVHEFLNMIRPRLKFDGDSAVEMHIDETFMPKGIGLVIGGFLKKGTIKIDREYFLGPMGDGSFKKVKCRSLHVNRTQVQQASPGRYVCFNVPKVERKQVSKGMVIVSAKEQCVKVETFTAEIIVYRTHHTTIRLGYETMVHVNALRAVAKLLEIKEKKKVKLRKSTEIPKSDDAEDDITSLSLGDRAIIKLQFKQKPRYLSVGDRILLAESKIKMTGRVTAIEP